jgi:hypothetical protein
MHNNTLLRHDLRFPTSQQHPATSILRPNATVNTHTVELSKLLGSSCRLTHLCLLGAPPDVISQVTSSITGTLQALAHSITCTEQLLCNLLRLSTLQDTCETENMNSLMVKPV